jgi:hypothetical protein
MLMIAEPADAAVFGIDAMYTRNPGASIRCAYGIVPSHGPQANN